MSTVSAYEAKTHFSELLARAERGERVTITKHGRAVARLEPVEASSARSLEEIERSLAELRKGCSLGGLSIKELIAEGRR